MSEFEIGAGKRGRRAYAFDDIAVVPSRRTRDPQDVSVQWSIDAFTFSAPILSAPMDSVASPATVIQMGKLGVLGVLDLEGLWTRYEDPTPYYDEIKTLTDGNVTKRMQEIYSEPVKAELITARLAEIRAAGVRSPARSARSARRSSRRPSSTPGSTCSSSAARPSPPSTSRRRPSRSTSRSSSTSSTSR